jgi:hypothetical protein
MALQILHAIQAPRDISTGERGGEKKDEQGEGEEKGAEEATGGKQKETKDAYEEERVGNNRMRQ